MQVGLWGQFVQFVVGFQFHIFNVKLGTHLNMWRQTLKKTVTLDDCETFYMIQYRFFATHFPRACQKGWTVANRILCHLTYCSQDVVDHQESFNCMNKCTKYFWFLTLFSFLSGLSLALNKEGCDWQDRHSARANSGWATHLSQTRYTPLVEVNQAIKAWSF